MATAAARMRNLAIAPRKVRLVADLIRGKKVPEALEILEFTQKKSAPELRKLLASAVANAEHAANEAHQTVDPDDMVVARIMVDQGRTFKRWRPAPRGRATPIRKRRSHISIQISDEVKANSKSKKN